MTVTTLLPPGAMVADVVSTVNTPLLLLILLTERVEVPTFEMVKVPVPLLPVLTLPILNDEGDIEISGSAIVKLLL